METPTLGFSAGVFLFEIGSLRSLSEFGNKTGSMLLIRGFPNGNDLINRHKAHAFFGVVQMQYAIFDLHDFSAEARSTAAVEINFLADEFGKHFLHDSVSGLIVAVSKRYVH
jgi:hypothetical protein